MAVLGEIVRAVCSKRRSGTDLARVFEAVDGLELLEAMEGSYPGLPSMVVSAYGDPDRMARASECGASAFVVKPVDFPALRELLSSSLALSCS